MAMTITTWETTASPDKPFHNQRLAPRPAPGHLQPTGMTMMTWEMTAPASLALTLALVLRQSQGTTTTTMARGKAAPAPLMSQKMAAPSYHAPRQFPGQLQVTRHFLSVTAARGYNSKRRDDKETAS